MADRQRNAETRDTEVPVVFRPATKPVYVLPQTRILEAAAGAGIVLSQPCGGGGQCGKCVVKVVEGAGEPLPSECETFSTDELRAGYRLACQSSITAPSTIDVSSESRLASHHKILAEGAIATQYDIAPAVSKRYVELPPPVRGDDVPDVVRLRREIGPFAVDLECLRQIPPRLRETGFRGTAVLAGGRLLDFESGNTASRNYAVAIDLGTTTLAGILLDASATHFGKQAELAVVSRLNPQVRFGDDVLSRIVHATSHGKGISQLQDAVIEAINDMLGQLAGEAGVRLDEVYDVVCSGNTTMQQLLCGVDPKPLGEVPFVPAMGRQPLIVRAADLGLRVHPHANVCVVPVIGGFVGGDTVSGILASELTANEGPNLLVDVGTNGEIVLFADGRLLAASTAAGPAFEGARILHGMRGSQGAIEKVTVDGHLRVNVIGNARPVGLCGSALIDVAAELLKHRLLTSQGRLLDRQSAPGNAPPDLTERLIQFDGQPAFQLVSQEKSGREGPVVVTQRDFRELQLATGAIRAGITILLRRAGVEEEQLQSVLIAGGFGNFIRRSNAQRIGLLPQKVAHHRMRYQGNTSLAGARLMALSESAREAAEDFARRTEHVDLSFDPDFQIEFAEAMIFPADA